MSEKLPIRRLFHVVNGGTPTSDAENWNGGVPWATPVDLAKVNGTMLSETERTLTPLGLATGSRTVRTGSLLVSTRAPIGYVAEVAQETAFNQGCRGLELRADGDIRFFRFQLSAAADQLAARGQGSTFIELSGDALAAFLVNAPPADEQRAIADHLDRATARIDALIVAKGHMKDLLAERRDAELRGFADPEHDADEHLVPIRRVLTKEERPPLLTDVVTAFRDGHVMARSRRRLEGFTESDARAGYQGVQPDDLVFHGLDGFAGAIGVSEDQGVCSPVYHVCSVRDGFDVNYVAQALRALALTGYLALQSGNVRERAVDFRNWDTLARIAIPVPPLEIQTMRANRFMSRREQTERLTVGIDRQVSLLRERRQALITAAVTGQIEVPVAA